MKLTFKKYLEATDIFGFDDNRSKDEPDDDMLSKPISQFNLELMMDILSKKKVGTRTPYLKFVNEMRWGDDPGAVKLYVDPGWSFYIQKMATDKQGNERWVTKKLFQLNRQGYGGLEDLVAHEIHNEIVKTHEGPLDAPINDYSDLEHLTQQIYNKSRKVMKHIFIPEGIRKLSDNAYIIKLGVRGQGVESMNHQRVEQNQTLVSYDPECGTIRITNYNIESPVGGGHAWRLNPNDFDVTCFPTQSRDEISELVAVNMKYY